MKNIKIWALIVALLVVVAVFVGCNNNNGTNDDTQTTPVVENPTTDDTTTTAPVEQPTEPEDNTTAPEEDSSKPVEQPTECAHEGGTATCQEKAVCEKCGEAYGSLSTTNHTQSAKWVKTLTTHSKTYGCCGTVAVAEEAHEFINNICVECGYVNAHVGGEATCTDQAVCDRCGESYGELAPTKHTMSTIWVQTETTHKLVYECCGAEVISEESHEWVDGVCSECEYVCGHTGGTATCVALAVCEICEESYGELAPENHTVDLSWTRTETTHKQLYECCGTVVIEEEAHEWAGGICLECGYGCEHTGGEATCTAHAVCTWCNQTYGEINPENHTGENAWTKTETKHTRAYTCCGAVTVETEAHEWANGVCSECEYVCGHIGGTATCTAQATCAWCGEAYGELNPKNHTGATEWTKTATTHSQAYTCCGTVTVVEAEHSWFGGECAVCTYVCEHTGGEATCTDKAVCTECNQSYGALNPDNHTGENAWTKVEAAHMREYTCCGEVTVPMAAHNWADGVCADCEYACAHKGGEATCTNLAVCTVCNASYGELDPENHVAKSPATCKKQAVCKDCGKSYGELDPENHAADPDYTANATTHTTAYICCGLATSEPAPHNWKDGFCVDCKYECLHGNNEDTYWTKTATTHTEYYACGAVKSAEEDHLWNDGVCEVCDYACQHNWVDGVCTLCELACSHTGGEATCTEKAVCTICTDSYGALAPDNHTGTPEWINTEATHTKAYTCCNVVVVEEANHTWNKDTCTVCEYVCEHSSYTSKVTDASCTIMGSTTHECDNCDHYYIDSFVTALGHTGGTATCQEQATCDRCGNKYGEINAENHASALEWAKTATTHTATYNCCGEVAADGEHNWSNGVCTACEYTCSHIGGTATCQEQATCTTCGVKYGSVNPSNHALTIDAAAWNSTEATCDKYCSCGEKIFSQFHTFNGNGTCTTCGRTNSIISLVRNHYASGSKAKIPVTFNGASPVSYTILLYKGTSYNTASPLENLIMYYKADAATGFVSGGGTGVNVYDQTTAKSLPIGTYTIRVWNSLNQVVDCRTIEIIDTEEVFVYTARDLYNLWKSPAVPNGGWGFDAQLITENGKEILRLTTNSGAAAGGAVGAGRLFLTMNDGAKYSYSGKSAVVAVKYRGYSYGRMDVWCGNTFAEWAAGRRDTIWTANSGDWLCSTAWNYAVPQSFGTFSLDLYTGIKGATVDIMYVSVSYCGGGLGNCLDLVYG